VADVTLTEEEIAKSAPETEIIPLTQRAIIDSG